MDELDALGVSRFNRVARRYSTVSQAANLIAGHLTEAKSPFPTIRGNRPYNFWNVTNAWAES
jgi:hypothetical protein